MSAEKKKPAKKTSKEVAVLKPKKLPDGRWQVSLGITMVNGRRTNPRKQFKTRADAQDFCDAEKRRKKAHGEITAKADGTKVAAWMKMDTKMDAVGVSLADVRSWIDLHTQLRETGAQSLAEVGKRTLHDFMTVKQHGTVVECHNAWLAHLASKGRRGRYKGNARNFCGNFIYGDAEFREEASNESKNEDGWKGFGADRSILEITPNVIEDYLPHHPGYFGVISAWLGWAAKKRWLPENPCTGKKPEQPPKGSVATLTNQQTKDLLKAAALEEDWEVLAYLVFSLFATLRPEEYRKVSKGSPTEELRWEYLKSDGLEIPPELAKTGHGRVVELDPVVIKWIDYIRSKQGVIPSGPIPTPGWTKNCKDWRKKHWKGKWPQDLLRHTFGSNHLARSQSLEITSRVMGNSPKVLEKHYWNWRTRKKEALVYWELTPKVVLKK